MNFCATADEKGEIIPWLSFRNPRQAKSLAAFLS
jgi:hypothetical protein